jgi:hypothetical protein
LPIMVIRSRRSIHALFVATGAVPSSSVGLMTTFAGVTAKTMVVAGDEPGVVAVRLPAPVPVGA